jgi:hypothetical protein
MIDTLHAFLLSTRFKVLNDGVAMIAAPEVVLLFIIEIASTMDKCPDQARLNVLEFR